MSSALSLYELDSEHAELLPARETLLTVNFVSPFTQVNNTTQIAVALGGVGTNQSGNAIAANFNATAQIIHTR